MESFADVLHGLVDAVFSGQVAEKAHDILDKATGLRTAPTEPEPAPAAEPVAEPTAEPTPEVTPPPPA